MGCGARRADTRSDAGRSRAAESRRRSRGQAPGVRPPATPLRPAVEGSAPQRDRAQEVLRQVRRIRAGESREARESRPQDTRGEGAPEDTRDRDSRSGNKIESIGKSTRPHEEFCRRVQAISSVSRGAAQLQRVSVHSRNFQSLRNFDGGQNKSQYESRQDFGEPRTDQSSIGTSRYILEKLRTINRLTR
uniref:Uncharacterized protein n=1 Tax=Trichogramma kaykai TaxID=54128 RepID=A0ABD2W4G3_9HYME